MFEEGALRRDDLPLLQLQPGEPGVRDVPPAAVQLLDLAQQVASVAAGRVHEAPQRLDLRLDALQVAHLACARHEPVLGYRGHVDDLRAVAQRLQASLVLPGGGGGVLIR